MGWGQGCLELVWLLTNPKAWGKKEMGAQLNQSSHEVMKEVTQGHLGNRAAPSHPSLRKQLLCRRSELRDVCPQACLCEEVRVFLNVLGDYFCSFEDSFALMPCWPIIYSVAKTILELTASGSQVVCPEPPCRCPFLFPSSESAYTLAFPHVIMLVLAHLSS